MTSHKKNQKDDPKAMFDTSPGFFGEKLDHEAPIVVCDCIAFIRNRGLYDVGVFRIPGNQDVVNVLKEKYNAEFATKDAKQEKRTSILNKHRPAPTVNDVASLLKAFFKDLPGPIIPVDSTQKMIEVIKLGLDAEEEKRRMSKIMKSIKRPQRECLGLLISFLREICSFKKFNQMNAENLSTCFVLSLMGGSDAFDQLFLLGNGAVIIKKLISTPIRIYMPSVSNVKSNTRYRDIKTKSGGPQIVEPIAVSSDNVAADKYDGIDEALTEENKNKTRWIRNPLGGRKPTKAKSKLRKVSKRQDPVPEPHRQVTQELWEPMQLPPKYNGWH